MHHGKGSPPVIGSRHNYPIDCSAQALRMFPLRSTVVDCGFEALADISGKFPRIQYYWQDVG